MNLNRMHIKSMSLCRTHVGCHTYVRSSLCQLVSPCCYFVTTALWLSPLSPFCHGVMLGCTRSSPICHTYTVCLSLSNVTWMSHCTLPGVYGFLRLQIYESLVLCTHKLERRNNRQTSCSGRDHPPDRLRLPSTVTDTIQSHGVMHNTYVL